MAEEKDIWDEKPKRWRKEELFSSVIITKDFGLYRASEMDTWLEKLKTHYAPIEEKTEPEVYSREFLRQAEAFRALASIIRRSTPPQTAKDLADVLIIEGLADVCEGLAESVMKEKK